MGTRLCVGLIGCWGLFAMGASPGESRSALTALAKRPDVKERPFTRSRIQPRVVDGKDAEDPYPWMTALLYVGGSVPYDDQFCGGSLIHPSWVITAAHCVWDLNPADLEVRVGIRDLDQAGQGELRQVVEILVHEDFSDFNLNHDVALLRLSEPVTNLPTVSLVEDPALTTPGVLARILGWGAVDALRSTYPAILQEGDVQIASVSYANALPEFSGGLSINMLPAGSASGGTDACSGDSGGPLLVRASATDPWYLAGLTSFGIGDCGNTLSVYTDVQALRPWILRHILPDFAAWESRFGVQGQEPVPPGSPVNHWSLFAFGLGPVLPPPGSLPHLEIHPESLTGEIEFQRPASVTDLLYTLWQGSTPEALDSATPVTGTVTANGDVETFRMPLSLSDSNTLGFVRIQADLNPDTANRVRTLQVPGFIRHQLVPGEDPPERVYRLEGLPLATAHRITARSSGFNVGLDLLDSNRVVVATSTSNTAGGKDEFLDLAAGATKVVYARVRPQTAGTGGRFDLTAQPVSSGLTTLSVGQTRTGSISSSTGTDPWWYPPVFYAHDYLVSPPYPGNPLEARLSATTFDATVYVLDYETGQPLFAQTQTDPERFTWTPNSRKAYRVRVTSLDESTTGNYSLKLVSLTPPPALTVGGAYITEYLTTTDETDPLYPGSTYYKDDYTLTGFTVGTPVILFLNSGIIDMYLEVINAADGSLIVSDDDSGPGTNARLTFTPQSGITYWIRATTASPNVTGVYLLGAL